MSYKRPQHNPDPHRIHLEVLNSRFIASVSRATSVEQARAFIQAIRSEMPDASHHVYAYRIGHGNSVIDGMSDAGEPSGTSGPPTLAVLRGSGLGDIVLVTTRYFGGTKLGTGGLVRAYTEAAQVALESLPVEEKAEKSILGVELPYQFYESLLRDLETFELHIDDKTFSTTVTLIVTILSADESRFRAVVQDVTAGQAEVLLLGKRDD